MISSNLKKCDKMLIEKECEEGMLNVDGTIGDPPIGII